MEFGRESLIDQPSQHGYQRPPVRRLGSDLDACFGPRRSDVGNQVAKAYDEWSGGGAREHEGEQLQLVTVQGTPRPRPERAIVRDDACLEEPGGIGIQMQPVAEALREPLV